MPFEHLLKSKTALALISLVAVTGLAAAAYSHKAGGLSSQDPKRPATPATPPPSVPGVAASSKIKAVLFTVRPDGFEPSEITLPEGKYVIAVDNRSGADEVLLNVRRGQSDRLKEVRLTRQQLNWRGVIDLKPGLYTVSDVNRPEWAARLQVTPK
jgi:hypothetical protein